MNMSELIKAKREDHGMTQNGLAMELGVTQGRVSTWENGVVPESRYLVQIMMILDISNEEAHQALGGEQ